MSDTKKEAKRKMIFAKATAVNFCAIVIYTNEGKMMVCDVLESDKIEDFIDEVEVVSKKHKPDILHYECSVYLHECKDLRMKLYKDNIKVRGYKSEGSYMNRIISQASWIESNVYVNDVFTDFADQILSFNISDTDKTNIALDILSDATKYLRRNVFK